MCVCVCVCLYEHVLFVYKTITLRQIEKVQYIEFDVPHSRNINTVSRSGDDAVAASEQTSRSRAAEIVDS